MPSGVENASSRAPPPQTLESAKSEQCNHIQSGEYSFMRYL